jgi:hypothetical protein
MKRIALVIALFAVGFTVKAQTPYKTALGIAVDLSKDVTHLGPQFKYVFGKNAAIQAQVMFSDNKNATNDRNTMYVGADYQYIKNFPKSKYAAWYLGVGPELEFVNDHTNIVIRPQAGLDFRIPSTPIGAHVDWKPYWRLNHGSDFFGDRFTLGLKFLVK